MKGAHTVDWNKKYTIIEGLVIEKKVSPMDSHLIGFVLRSYRESTEGDILSDRGF